MDWLAQQESLMALNDKLMEILLHQFNFSQTDLDKVKAILDNINVKTVDGKTYIEIRVNKVTVVLEGNQNES
jgi:hypothetical protein